MVDKEIEGLRTLKDVPTIETEGGEMIAVNKLYMKKIAIEWIKSFEYGKPVEKKFVIINENLECDVSNLVAWIKYFNNITEEDLE